MTRKSYPLGAAPYSAALISLSVPSTPTRSTRTRTPRPAGMSDSDGLASSARCTLLGRPGTTAIAFIGLSALLKKFRHERRPAGLMARADRRARIAVEILVERYKVVPVRIGLQQLGPAKYGPPALGIVQEDSREPARHLCRDLGERQHLSRSRRALDAVLVAEVVMKLLQRLDEQEVDREPD